MKLSSRSFRSALLATPALVAVACSDLPTDAAAPASPPVAAPATPAGPAPAASERPFFHGAFLGDEQSKPERIEAEIRGFAQQVGKAPALVKTFHNLSCQFSAEGWCGQLVRKISGAGATNFLALDLRWPGAPSSGVLDAINAGAADGHFARVARELAGFNAAILLEPGWEMNGDWGGYTWQGVANGRGSEAPAKYALAWRRIHDIFRREGASNVRWVWSPNVGNHLTNTASGATHWNWYANYYPGDGYVDYVGAHGFNAPRLWGGRWKDFGAMVDGSEADHMLSDLARRYPTKPIIIGEFATDEGASSPEKAEWIRGAYQRMRAHPQVVGAVWFNMSKEADWRVNSSPAALAAYQEAMRDRGILATFRDVSVGFSRGLLARR